MLRVGIVGWRGMVGSVLVQRMREERDFDHIEPEFFSTSQAGGRAPAIGKDGDPVNMDLIREGRARGIRNYIGGNCTVSFMLMGMAGLFQRHEIQPMTTIAD